MTLSRLCVCGLLGLLTYGGGQGAPQQPTFRARGEAVAVDVSVLQNRRPVSNLTPADFVLYDRGARQKIAEARVESSAVSVTLLLDTSQSMDDPRIASGSSLMVAQDELRRALRPDDTLRQMSFAEIVHEGLPPALGVGRGKEESRQTALFDAVVLALATPATPGQRHLIVVLTDGVDTISSTPRTLWRSVAEHSEGVVHMVIVRKFNEMGMFGPFGGSGFFRQFTWMLSDLIETTGGRLFEVPPDARYIDAILAAIEEFRLRYVLSFSPSGAEPGWHDLKVEVPGRPYDVQHRRGYWRR